MLEKITNKKKMSKDNILIKKKLNKALRLKRTA